MCLSSHRAKHGGREGGTGWRASGRHLLLSGDHSSGTEEWKNPTEQNKQSTGGGAFNFPSASSSSFLSSTVVALEFQWRGFKVSGSVAEGFIKQEAATASEDPSGSPLKLAGWLKKRKKKERSIHADSLPRGRGLLVLERKSSLGLKVFRERV